MRPSILLALILSSTAIATHDLEWVFENIGLLQPWGVFTKPCFDIMKDTILNNVVTLVIPRKDAIDRFKSSPEFASITEDKLCDLVKYHIIRGSYRTEDMVEAGPFLQTMLNRPGANNSEATQALQVESGQGISFYSGLGRKSNINYDLHVCNI